MLKSWSLPKQKEIVLIFLKFYNIRVKIFIKNLILLVSALPFLAMAGTIEGDQYAWGENVGWINFGTEHGGVTVTDSAVTGHAWDTIYGWINLAPQNGGVLNDGAGNLSGQAWSQNAGWIDFDGVTIDGTSGLFSGMAEGDIYGRINFDCRHCSVVTDWRSASSVSESQTVGSSGGMTSSLYSKTLPPLAQEVLGAELAEKIKKVLAILTPDFIQARLFSGEKSDLLSRELLPKQTPLALKNPSILLSPEPERFALSPAVKSISLALKARWQITPREAIRFALQGLPKDVVLFTNKFPQVGQVLSEIGVNRMSDVKRLQGLRLVMPSLSNVLSLQKAEFQANKVALVKRVPVAELSVAEKEKMPSETIFARALEERIDLKTSLTFNAKGQPLQEIHTIVGKKVDLVIKPDAPTRKITGYIVLSEPVEEKTVFRSPKNLLLAMTRFAMSELIKLEESKLAEKAFVLSEFEYYDEDNDGIYSASIEAPVVAGKYKMITTMDYLNPDLGVKEINMIVVVDPEGYVFTKSGLYEARISEATVTLWWLNSQKDEYQIWPAEEYLQENPQVTGPRGTYSFLVPEGTYYITTVVKGFKSYQSDSFKVKEGNGVYMNIELLPNGSWLARINWELIVLIIIALVVVWRMVAAPLIRKRNRC